MICVCVRVYVCCRNENYNHLTLLVVWQEGHPACKKLGCWHGYVCGSRCRFSCGPAHATATHFLFLQYIQLLFSRYSPTFGLGPSLSLFRVITVVAHSVIIIIPIGAVGMYPFMRFESLHPVLLDDSLQSRQEVFLEL